MENKKLILVIEDDNTIRKFISTALITQDYDVIECNCGKDGIASAVAKSPDVILLDLGLGDIDGIKVIETVKQITDIPIIVVSAREQDRDKVEAFDMGADDYITKPFSVVELLARIRVALRHSERKTSTAEVIKREEDNDVFSTGELKIDFNRRNVYVGDELIHLTPIEYDILSLLARNHGKVLTHNFIIKNIWGGTIGGETQSLRVFMASLRRKIEKEPANPKYIMTEVRVGYRLNDQV